MLIIISRIHDLQIRVMSHEVQDDHLWLWCCAALDRSCDEGLHVGQLRLIISAEGLAAI